MVLSNLFRYIEPHILSGLFDDPLLLIRTAPGGEHLLFDCGDISHLSKKIIKPVTKVFISHAHMDHFMGMIKLARTLIVTDRVIDVFGPPGIAERLASMLQGFEWNLTESYFCRFQVHEIYPELIKRFLLKGGDGFRRTYIDQTFRDDLTIVSGEYYFVEAEICDHKIPSVIYRIHEKPGFLIDESSLNHSGIKPGKWIDELKNQWKGHFANNALPAALDAEELAGCFKDIHTAKELYLSLAAEHPVPSLGYTADMGFTEENISKVTGLMKGVSVLVTECSYALENKGKARKTFHLCTEDVTALLQRVQPGVYIPQHISKTYLHRREQVLEEIKLPEKTRMITQVSRIAEPPIGWEALRKNEKEI